MWAPIALDKLFVSYTLHDESLEHLNTWIAFGRSYKSPEGTIWLMAYMSVSAWAIHFLSDDAAASRFHWVILKSLSQIASFKGHVYTTADIWEGINFRDMDGDVSFLIEKSICLMQILTAFLLTG